tara:strand:- start:1800 stop:2576 length:777 start_codon:yes stop_codon:yes gene_type:complete
MDKDNLKVVIENKMNNSMYTKLIMVAIIVVLIFMNWTSCESKKEDKRIYEQNQEAMKKEVVVEKNKNGELQSSVVAFEGNSKDIKKYSESLSQELKNLKNRKPSVITKIKIVYKVDTQYVYNNTIDTVGLDNDEYRLSWKYNDNDSTRFLEGNSIFKAIINGNNLSVTPIFTTLTRDEMQLDFVVGVVKNKKTKFNEIFITPKNENITIGSMEGAILGRSKLGINISFSAGYGVYYGDSKFGLAPFVGISISKPILKF